MATKRKSIVNKESMVKKKNIISLNSINKPATKKTSVKKTFLKKEVSPKVELIKKEKVTRKKTASKKVKQKLPKVPKVKIEEETLIEIEAAFFSNPPLVEPKPTNINITYHWELDNIIVDDKKITKKIKYNYTGTIDNTDPVKKFEIPGQYSVIKNSNSRVETSDYRFLSKDELLDYLIENISQIEIETLQNLIQIALKEDIQQLLNNSEEIDKSFWQ
jgi:hypothetical protein